MSAILFASLLLVPGTALACYGFAFWMRRRALGQQIRDVGPRSHASKAGTPTMGGAVLLLGWIGGILVLTMKQGWPSYAGFVLASGLVFGGMGLVDDILSIRRKHSTGLTGPQKIVLGSVLSVALFFAFQDQVLIPQRIPFSDSQVALPWLAALSLTWILLVSSTNSANLTDGLDGLSGGIAVLVLAGLMIAFPTIQNALLILPLVGALAGFLWLNAYPASLFMGDVGSFALGGIIGALALANGAAFLLPLFAGVFVLEAMSVILQVATLKLTGKRVFKMSPLHHHFEASPSHGRPYWVPGFEWPESKVTARFILIQVAFVILALVATGR